MAIAIPVEAEVDVVVVGRGDEAEVVRFEGLNRG